MDDAFLIELKTGFLQEASELLEKVEETFIQLEKDPNNPAHLQSLFRLAHNLKGSGKAVGFDSFAAFCHELENLLVALKNKQVSLSAATLGVLFECVDQLKVNIETLKKDFNSVIDNAGHLEKIHRALGATNSESAQTSIPQAPSPAPRPEAEKTKAPTPDSGSEEVLRVPTRKVEDVLNTLGEQAILQSALDHALLESEVNEELLRKTIRQLSKLTFELQQTTISLRMVNLKTLVNRLERAVRDASTSTGKKVNFKTQGAENELDKGLIDALVDPLIHMVRNSVDHGIEDIATRRQLGKPEVGTIEIRARRSGAQFLIEVLDDGKGLDPERIKDKAVQAGLIPSDSNLPESEIFKLIFANGFSTRDEVSALSGRGVGMNVVETTIQQLKGSIEIHSTLGQGTRFTLRLPLTLALFNGIVFRTAGQQFVVPSGDIDEIVPLDGAQMRHVPMQGTILKVRDEILPVFDLRKHFGSDDPERAIAKRSALIVRSQGKRKAFLIDELLFQSRIVHKKLGKELKTLKVGSGAAVLGDGSVALILDLPAFTEAAQA